MRRNGASHVAVQVPVGFRNREEQSGESRVCFAIAAVQALLSYQPFVRAFEMLKALPALLPQCSRITQTLVHLASALLDGSDPNALFQTFCVAALTDAHTRLRRGYARGQNDAGELLLDLIQHLHDDGGIAVALGELSPFGHSQFRTVEELSCSRGIGAGRCEGLWTVKRRGKSNRFDTVLAVPAAQIGSKGLVSALLENTRPEAVNVECRSCKMKGAVYRCTRFRDPPKLLVSVVNRWDSRGNKSNKAITVPASAHVAAMGADYELVSAICHHGADIETGHWTAFVERAGEWFRANDTSVSRVGRDSHLRSRDFKTTIVLALFRRVSEQHGDMAIDSEEDDDDGEERKV